ncbi:MAG: hypothetical protein ACLQGV_16155 [Bryobacteraceae bacterium]
MRISIGLFSLATVLVVRGTVGSEAPQPPFAITINAPQTALKTNSEVRVGISLRDISNHEIYFSQPPGVGLRLSDGDIEVRDDKGNLMPSIKSQQTIQTKDLLGPTFSYGSYVCVSLKPGETLQGEIVVSELFDLHRSGKYTIQVKRTDAATKTAVKSNIIALTLTE